MELHILLGVVYHLYKNCDLWPIAEKWPTALHIPVQPYYVGHFNGNDCMKLLRGINKLQELSERGNFVQALGFIHTLKQFEVVEKACFGKNLDSDFEAKIWKFKQKYVSLSV